MRNIKAPSILDVTFICVCIQFISSTNCYSLFSFCKAVAMVHRLVNCVLLLDLVHLLGFGRCIVFWKLVLLPSSVEMGRSAWSGGPLRTNCCLWSSDWDSQNLTSFREIFAFCCQNHTKYEGWNFNFGNAAVTFDTAHLQSSYFHRPSMYSPKLCIARSQRWGSRMMPLAAPGLLMVRTERSTAEGLNPPCNCPIR